MTFQEGSGSRVKKGSAAPHVVRVPLPARSLQVLRAMRTMPRDTPSLFGVCSVTKALSGSGLH